MPELYFENSKTGKRYKVVNFDKEAGKVTLQSEIATFTDKYDKELFQKLGYKLVQG